MHSVAAAFSSTTSLDVLESELHLGPALSHLLVIFQADLRS